MTGNELGEGARTHRSAQRRRWMLHALWVATLIALVWTMIAMQDGSGRGSLTANAAIGFASAIGVTFVFGNIALFRIVDEVDFRDNLTALTMGYIANATVVLVWLVLFYGNLAGPPHAVMSLGVGTAAAAVVYGVLKLRRGV